MILGLHFTGNEFDTDSQGYLRPDGNVNPSSHCLMTRISENLETGTVAKKTIGLSACSNCWICEGWSQMNFVYKTKVGKKFSDFDLVYTCLSIDGYEPDLM